MKNIFIFLPLLSCFVFCSSAFPTSVICDFYERGQGNDGAKSKNTARRKKKESHCESMIKNVKLPFFTVHFYCESVWMSGLGPPVAKSSAEAIPLQYFLHEVIQQREIASANF